LVGKGWPIPDYFIIGSSFFPFFIPLLEELKDLFYPLFGRKVRVIRIGFSLYSPGNYQRLLVFPASSPLFDFPFGFNIISRLGALYPVP